MKQKKKTFSMKNLISIREELKPYTYDKAA